MAAEKPILIYGSRDFSYVVHALINTCGYQFSGFIDDFDNDRKGILGSFAQVRKSHPPSHFSIALAIGYNNLALRKSIYSKIIDAGYQLPPLIHPSVIAHESAEIKDGVMLMAGVNIDIKSTVNSISVLWPNTIVSHDCTIGTNTFLSPGVTICGYSKIGANCFVGASAIVTDHIEIPDNSFIRAGEIIHSKTLFLNARD